MRAFLFLEITPLRSMNQEIELSASTVFKIVEILIIASLLVLLPGHQPQSTEVQASESIELNAEVIQNVQNIHE